MEEFEQFINKASRNIEIADHILNISYPALEDPKILLIACENIFLAFSNSLSAAVYYERRFKRIPPFKEDFNGKFEAFSKKIVPRHGIKREILVSIEEVRDLILKHEESPVEFRRKESFVICDDSYKYETLTAEKLRYYLEDAKKFYIIMSEITKKHANIFKRERPFQ